MSRNFQQNILKLTLLLCTVFNAAPHVRKLSHNPTTMPQSSPTISSSVHKASNHFLERHQSAQSQSDTETKNNDRLPAKDGYDPAGSPLCKDAGTDRESKTKILSDKAVPSRLRLLALTWNTKPPEANTASPTPHTVSCSTPR
jgi:hypothetical protein